MSKTNGNILRAVHRSLGGLSFGELADLVDQAATYEARERELKAAVAREQERLTQVQAAVGQAQAKAAEILASAQHRADAILDAAGMEADGIRQAAQAKADAATEAAQATTQGAEATADRLMAEARTVVATLESRRQALADEVAALEAKRAEAKAFLAKLSGG